MLDNPAKVFYHLGLGKTLAAFFRNSVYYKEVTLARAGVVWCGELFVLSYRVRSNSYLLG